MSGSLPPFPPQGVSILQSVDGWGAYLYSQYSDDDDLQAFIDAFNDYIQRYVDWYDQINLPIYTGFPIVGELLDWVANGIYGYPRPHFATPQDVVGEWGQLMFAQTEWGGSIPVGAPTVYTATDDQYKRSLTWHFYKGDGKQFTFPWLKRRLARWLLGTDGTAPNIDNTYDISVTTNGSAILVILGSGIGTSDNRQFLAAAINTRNFEMPVQFAVNVVAAL